MEARRRNLGVKDGKKKRRIFSSRAIVFKPNLVGNQYNAELRRRAKIGFAGTILRKRLD
jgi:hypothetical protein